MGAMRGMSPRRFADRRTSRLLGVVTLSVLVLPIAAFEPSAGAAAPRRHTLLPNLVPLPTGVIIVNDTGPYPNSMSQPSFAINACRIDEMVEQGARRCLRFDTAVANLGTGPAEVRYRPSADTEATLVQRVFRSDGSYFDRPAAPSDFHVIHGHFHYRNFSISRLWRADEEGHKIGKRPIVTGQKNGFCFEDTARVEGDGESRYNCLEYEASNEGADRVTGISVGFADVYTYILNGQYLEITTVPDGRYLLETSIDPDKTLLEKTRRDNTVRVLIEICGDRAGFVEPGRKACA